jgi:hypothetical protein
MIKEVKAWQVFCDICGKVFPDPEEPVYFEKKEDIEIYPDDDWIEEEGKHICFECQIKKIPEEN